MYLSDEVTDMISNADGDTRGIGVYFRLGTDPALHLCMSANDIPIGMESIDPDGTIYYGAGGLKDLPDLDIIINGRADSIEFGLDGIRADQFSAITNDIPDVMGSRIHIGIAPYDHRWQPRTPIIMIWRGTADFLIREMQPAKPGDPWVYSIAVAATAGYSTRARPPRVSFTHAQQQIAYPGDRFFERVTRYTGTYFRIWPKGS